MIDTQELRRLAQAAMHPVTKGRWMRLFGERTVYDRMEDGCRGIPVVSTPFSPPHLFEAACLDFVAAANPAAISELLDRLEAAEKAVNEAYQRGYETGQEEVEKERDALRSSMKFRTSLIGRTEAERDALRTVLTDLLNDLEERAKWNLEESQRVVACRNGVYMRAKAALEKSK